MKSLENVLCPVDMGASDSCDVCPKLKEDCDGKDYCPKCGAEAADGECWNCAFEIDGPGDILDGR